jgi:hypothetical protein
MNGSGVQMIKKSRDEMQMNGFIELKKSKKECGHDENRIIGAPVQAHGGNDKLHVYIQQVISGTACLLKSGTDLMEG